MIKKISISTICIMILSVLFHFMYKWFPCTLTSIFFPVNKSIWEHGKMIIMAFIFYILIEKFIFKENTNIIFSNLLACDTCIVLDFVIFTPIFLYIMKTKDNMIVTIGIYLLCIIISLIIKEKIYKKEKDDKKEIIAIICFVFMIIFFAVLSYHPIKLPIFYDYNKNIYGIK